MNTKDVRSMVDMIRDANRKDLVIVSLFLLPLLLGAWSILLNSLDYLDEHDGWKLLIIGLLLASYVLGLINMKRTDTQEDRLRRAMRHVETRLRKRGGHRASFDAIRNEVNEDYTNAFLKQLIDLNPELFGTCTIKKGNKQGITLVNLESEDTQHQGAVDAATRRD